MATNNTIRTAWANDVITAAGTGAKVNLYSGAIPVGGASPAGTLLAECVVAGALGTASAGVITLGAVTGDASGDASGTPTFMRVLTSADVWIGDYAISGFPAITVSQPVAVTAGTITMGQ